LVQKILLIKSQITPFELQKPAFRNTFAPFKTPHENRVFAPLREVPFYSSLLFSTLCSKIQVAVSHYAGKILLLVCLSCIGSYLSAQQQYELSADWKCIKASAINKSGEQISNPAFPLSGWMPSVVPGTVLTTLLANKLIPDPFYGMNIKRIPDIYDVGSDYYTYWFIKDFTESVKADDKVQLLFRGINYSYTAFLNGHKLNSLLPQAGMYLRHSYDITPYLAKNGRNRLAVIVYPPNPAGKPNGGQGGDGIIAHNITNQFVAGWDWIQPIHDRNTGIWDKVFIKKTKQVKIENTHVITLVPGVRIPGDKQSPATIRCTTEVENTGDKNIEGTLIWKLGDKTGSIKMTIGPGKQLVRVPDITLTDPKLWWPNGYGPQNLYNLKVKFLINDKTLSDEENVTVGVRQIDAVWNDKTNSREIHVNGQKIFIKGGNRIVSDAMLRFSKERYDAEIRYHRDMNLNLIRVWGGGITERPEFYDACDKYGILVMQDFWVSGDCNGRWDDPLKAEDTLARRNYPDDHHLFIESLVDQIYMLRNHPSLALWCGGNEIRPPADILEPLENDLLPNMDGTRFFFEYSNDDSMSLNSGDGPYTIQPDSFFFSHRSFPFNSEIGSVGIGDYESLERFIPKENLVPPYYDTAAKKWIVDSVWLYHKYIGYDSAIEAYGHPANVKDFAMKAQLVNYNQYRALAEGFISHAWDWYTGVIIWKTQNPWTAMPGQMYDVYLDPNACMYGLSEGAKPLHIMYDPVKKSVLIANNSPHTWRNIKACIRILNKEHTILLDCERAFTIPPNECINDLTLDLSNVLINEKEHFVSLTISDSSGLLDENIYWFPDSTGSYSWLNKMEQSNPDISAISKNKGEVTVTIENSDFNSHLAFFIRVSLVDKKTKKRILPVFCNNNYFSVLSGDKKTIEVEYTPQKGIDPEVCIEEWNISKRFIEIKH